MSLFRSLTDPQRWKQKRAENMQCARNCRDIAIQRGVTPDIRNKAVMFWVSRARRAHAIALGREAIIDNMVVIAGQTADQGALYARRL